MESNKSLVLINIFQNLLKATEKLHQLLLRETDALDTKSSSSLNSITAGKEQVIKTINHLTLQQNEFLQSFNLSGQKEGLARYIDQAANDDPHHWPELKTYWTKITETLEKCHQINQQNGARIELFSRHTERTLDIILGQSDLPYTYGPTGAKEKERTRQATISV